ncbi:hypothetical protein RV04_GL001740 [Enterococcus hermanniensis]|uniref:NADP-dependent oxidoreductase domain-containing protein n=1 Tax=Enterococcus hermanniensis TaxID=249189 RepID=A0A1L8TPH2_9ENTE|nr:hypothetical protein RV04_GL001740 [Enterococcus hermanniensis]
MVLAWYLTHPLIDIVIPGAKRPEQVAANAQSADIHLSKSDFDRIDQLFK